ncbi:MAG: hypothetical protein JW745_04710 [Sedimentisphaerales bacterium]|nr:hypothetical protein [Sedimentisphaerales bacterium]MBN2842121.1 hypothetical protein [Sedimentisphaerales bacterium]
MCTIGYIANCGLVFKNRDKSELVEQELITTDSFTALRTVGESYYAGGINRCGCGFVTAAVGKRLWPKEWLSASDTELISPSGFMSEKLADCQSVLPWLDHFRQCTNWQGFNLILFEPGKVFFVLLAGAKVEIRQSTTDEIHTNHFADFPGGHKTAEGSGSCDSFQRLNFAREMLQKDNSSTSLDSLQEALLTDASGGNSGLWLTEPKGVLLTVSSIIFAIADKRYYYSDNRVLGYRTSIC